MDKLIETRLNVFFYATQLLLNSVETGKHKQHSYLNQSVWIIQSRVMQAK